MMLVVIDKKYAKAINMVVGKQIFQKVEGYIALTDIMLEETLEKLGIPFKKVSLYWPEELDQNVYAKIIRNWGTLKKMVVMKNA